MVFQTLQVLEQPNLYRGRRAARILGLIRLRHYLHRVVGSAYEAMGACDNLRSALLDSRAVREIGALELVSVKGGEPGLNSDVEERVSPARHLLVDCTLDALTFEGIQVDGRGGHQQGRYQDAQEDAQHQPPVGPETSQYQLAGR